MHRAILNGFVGRTQADAGGPASPRTVREGGTRRTVAPELVLRGVDPENATLSAALGPVSFDVRLPGQRC